MPHAGYVFSGYEAAHVYYHLARQEKPELVVLLGPNHTGLGSTVAVSGEDWSTPLGEAECHVQVVEKLEKSCDNVTRDEMSHSHEHSIEVQIPFLQYIYGDFKFVALSLGLQTLEVARELGRCMADIEGDTLIMASSDFTHFESAERAREKDLEAIDSILELDEGGMMESIARNRTTACGYGAIAASMVASKLKGAGRGELLKYGNSGDVTGDYSNVVAYAGILFRKKNR